MSIISDAAKKATTQEKYELLQQYVANGGGTLRRNRKTGKLIFASKEYQGQRVQSQFAQGGTQGNTGMGGV